MVGRGRLKGSTLELEGNALLAGDEKTGMVKSVLRDSGNVSGSLDGLDQLHNECCLFELLTFCLRVAKCDTNWSSLALVRVEGNLWLEKVEFHGGRNVER